MYKRWSSNMLHRFVYGKSKGRTDAYQAMSYFSWLFEQVRDRAWFVRLYGDKPRALARGLSTVLAHKPCSISLVP